MDHGTERSVTQANGLRGDIAHLSHLLDVGVEMETSPP